MQLAKKVADLKQIKLTIPETPFEMQLYKLTNILVPTHPATFVSVDSIKREI